MTDPGPHEALSVRELRRFGLVLAAALVVVFALLLPWLFGRVWPRWPWAVAIVLIALALVHPRALAPLHRGWMKVGHVLGAINSRIVLGALFFLIIVPLGFVLRVLGKNPMRSADPQASSYRIETARRNDGKDMERPF